MTATLHLRRCATTLAMLAFIAAPGCLAELPTDSCVEHVATPAVPGPVRLDGPCNLDLESPTRLLVTTTDFATGAISVVDVETMVVTKDVGLGSTDAIPTWHDGMGLLVHRFQIDTVQVLDPGRDWALAAEIPIEAACSEAPNPQAVVFDADGLGYVTQLDVPELAIIDPRSTGPQARVGTIDLRSIPDVDGNADLGAAVACGSIVWVVAQRLDPSYSRRGPDELIAVDTTVGAPVDLDPDIPGAQGLVSAGAWLRQLRRDPADVEAHTLLGLSTGIERFDLSVGTVTWAVTPERFAAAGIVAPLQSQAFAIDADGTVAYLAAYDEDFSQVQLYRVGLDDAEPQTPQSFAQGFDSVEHTLERIGTRLWYGSTRRMAPGLWVFDLDGASPQPLAGPLSTGLPPYSMAVAP